MAGTTIVVAGAAIVAREQEHTERVRVSRNPTAVGIVFYFFEKPENPLKLGLEKEIQNIENPEWET